MSAITHPYSCLMVKGRLISQLQNDPKELSKRLWVKFWPHWPQRDCSHAIAYSNTMGLFIHHLYNLHSTLIHMSCFALSIRINQNILCNKKLCREGIILTKVVERGKGAWLLPAFSLPGQIYFFPVRGAPCKQYKKGRKKKKEWWP